MRMRSFAFLSGSSAVRLDGRTGRRSRHSVQHPAWHHAGRIAARSVPSGTGRGGRSRAAKVPAH